MGQTNRREFHETRMESNFITWPGSREKFWGMSHAVLNQLRTDLQSQANTEIQTITNYFFLMSPQCMDSLPEAVTALI